MAEFLSFLEPKLSVKALEAKQFEIGRTVIVRIIKSNLKVEMNNKEVSVEQLQADEVVDISSLFNTGLEIDKEPEIEKWSISRGRSASIMGKSSSFTKFVQINLKHSKLASANLLIFMIKNDITISLIQEPWVRDGKVMGLEHKDFRILYKAIDGGRPRSCIFIHKKFNSFLLSNYSDADNTAVRIFNLRNQCRILILQYLA